MPLEYKKSKLIRSYESIVIMDPTASEEEQKALFKKNQETIEGYEGEVHKVFTWGKRDLANPINKFKSGAYFHSYFRATPQVIQELERTMKINDKVLRFVHTRLEEGRTLEDCVEQYNATLKGSIERQQELDVRIQKKKAARAERFSGNNRDRNRDRDR